AATARRSRFSPANSIRNRTRRLHRRSALSLRFRRMGATWRKTGKPQRWSRWAARRSVTSSSFFSGMKLSAIIPGDVERFHAEMVDKKLGCKTRRNLHAILTKMFVYALELEFVEHSV